MLNSTHFVQSEVSRILLAHMKPGLGQGCQVSEDPSSLFELGASPFGLRPHKTLRQAEDRLKKKEVEKPRQMIGMTDRFLGPKGRPLGRCEGEKKSW